MKTFSLKALIFFYCVLLFSIGAGKSSAEFKGDENFYFESSRYMLESKDFTIPRYMNEERFQKPVFFYWFIVVAFKIFGVNWLAARLPSIILGSLCAVLVFRVVEELFQNRKLAVISSLFFATTPLCYRYARLAVPDMALVFFEAMALYFFIIFYKSRIRGYCMAFFASIAAAFMIKGPIGAVVPLLVSGVFLAFEKKRLFKFGDLASGLMLFALIVFPWFYFMHRKYPDRYAAEVFSREIAQRLNWGSGGLILSSYFKGFLFYLSAFTLKLFPYSLIALPALRKRDGEGRFFLIIWICAVFFLFTFVPERRTHYLLALAPAVSILAASLFKSANASLKAPLIIAGLLSGIYIFITVVSPFGLFANRMEPAARIIKSNMGGSRAVVAIGSHGIIPEELQVFFKEPVVNVKGTYTKAGLPSEDTVSKLREFLNSPERYFCVIKKTDYEAFILPEERENLCVVGSYYAWKRRIKFDNELKMALERGAVRDIFQNEIYIVTNRNAR